MAKARRPKGAAPPRPSPLSPLALLLGASLAVLAAVSAAPSLLSLLASPPPPPPYRLDAAPPAALEAQRAAEAAPHSPEAADLAAQAWGAFGSLLRATEWYVAALSRRVALAGGAAAQVGAARRYGLLHLAMHLELHAIQLGRQLLRRGAPHLDAVEAACGGESRASRALRAAAAARELPRAALAEMVAQCVHEQRALRELVRGGADASLSRGGYSLLHLLAHFGSPALLLDAKEALPPALWEAQRRAKSAPGGLTPLQTCEARGFVGCAAALGEPPPPPPPPPPAGGQREAQAAGREAAEDGGWRNVRSRLVDALGLDEARCDIAVEEAERLGADAFRDRFLLAEVPVLLRNGSAARWEALRRELAYGALVEAHGALAVGVSAVPYHDGAEPRGTSLAAHARRVAEGAAAAEYLFLSLPPGPLRAAVEGHVPAVLRRSIAPEWLAESSVQFALGAAGSGAPAHYHKAAVNTLVYGRKKWWLAPPRDAIYSSTPVGAWAKDGPARARRDGRTLLECTQLPGDVLFVPDFWGHAVLNLEASVAVATEFPTARMQFQFEG